MERSKILAVILALSWMAGVTASYFYMNTDYYAYKISVFTGFFARILSL